MAEFALVLPLFVSLLLGLVSSGIVLNEKMQLTHASREGARHGATVPAAQTFSSGTWATNVRDVVVGRSAGELADADVCVALVTGLPATPIDSDHTTRADGLACYNDSASGITEARVQVMSVKPATIEAVFVNHDVTLRATATSKLEHDA